MKTASLVFFYFGEKSYLRALAQETVQLGLAFEGYSRKVLLKFPEIDAGPFKLNEGVEQGADVLVAPTRENLVRELNALAEAGYAVDIYIFSHGWNNTFLASKGTYGDDANVTGKYLEEHVKPMNIRAVWQCNCYGATLNDTWMKLGAKVTGGARYVNFYPTRFARFANLWNDGHTYEDAAKQADTALIHTPVQAFILADALSRHAEWGQCRPGSTVLGKNECAKAYFTKCWQKSAEWQDQMGGKQNMNYSSEFMLAGDGAQKKV